MTIETAHRRAAREGKASAMPQATFDQFQWSAANAVHAATRDVITVLLVDDQAQLLRGLEMLLALEADVRVVGTAGTAEDAIALAHRLKPDIVLMDVRLPGMDGISATRRLRRELPANQVIVLTLYGDAVTRQQAMQAGAAAFVAKHDMEGALLTAIREVAARDRTHHPTLAGEQVAPCERGNDREE
jgi:DNA-binding NarL/FixJ family response regulator